MAKKLRWKNPEPGLYTAGDFRVVKTLAGEWDMWHGGSMLSSAATKKACQQLAQEQADLYKGDLGTRKPADRPPFIMFDVKGEIAVVDGLINGLVDAGGKTYELRAVRVTYEGGGVAGGGGPGARMVPDVAPEHSSLAWTRLEQIAYVVTGAHGNIPSMTTMTFYGYPGDWVMVLLPTLTGG